MGRGLGGSGVSTQRMPNGTWRIRWRETVRDPDGTTRRVQRSLVVADQATAQEVAARVLRAVESGVLYEREAVREIPDVATVDDVLRGYLRSRAARGAVGHTLEGYGAAHARALASLRAAHQIPDDRPVPGALLTRDEVIALAVRVRAAGYSEGTVYTTVRQILAAWTWASDDPATYPGLGIPPRDPSTVLPQLPVYEAPPAPTLAECDAVIRRLHELPRAAWVSVPLAVIGRCTGLRMSQILALTVGDVELVSATLAVRTGKSRRERSGRILPIAPVLRDYLAPLVASRDRAEPLLRRRVGAVGRGPWKVVRRAWEEATQAGEVRREVWQPTGREIARPDHAFRAAFQGHLVSMGVRDEVIDLLVGHAPGLRGRHYVDGEARRQAAIEAVALIPPIAWGEEALPANVHRLR